MKLKEIAPYLAHGLKIVNTEFETGYDRIFTIGGVSEYWLDINFNEIDENDNGDNLKPIFRPLPDLTKPCLEGGGVPILELLNTCCKNIFGIDSNLKNASLFKEDYSFGVMAYDDERRVSLTYDVTDTRNSFDFYIDGSIMSINQLSIFNWLYKHHFWLGDQDRFGKDIIDINSLKQTI